MHNTISSANLLETIDSLRTSCYQTWRLRQRSKLPISGLQGRKCYVYITHTTLKPPCLFQVLCRWQSTANNLWFSTLCCARNFRHRDKFRNGRKQFLHYTVLPLLHGLTQDDAQYTPAVDMWSIGVIVYILLTVSCALNYCSTYVDTPF